MDRFPPPSSPRSAGPATFAKHLCHRAPAIGLRRRHSSRQHVSPSRWPLHRIPSRLAGAGKTCSLNSTIPILETKFCPVGRWLFGVRCWVFDLCLCPFLPITDLILSASFPLQHSNTPTFPAPGSCSPHSPPSFDVRCSAFGVRCLSFVPSLGSLLSAPCSVL